MQGDVPRRKPFVAETKLTEPGSKFAGTGAAAATCARPKMVVAPASNATHVFLNVVMPHITTVWGARFQYPLHPGLR